MTKCSLCGTEELCFRCPYCNGLYCGEHRLPESHGCPGIQRVKDDAKKKKQSTGSLSDDYFQENQTWIPYTQKRKPVRQVYRRKRFSKVETRDLTIASILVVLVGFSAFGMPYGILHAIQVIMSIPLVLMWIPVTTCWLFLLAFMGHELAHKFVAQHYGMWSEFRMTTMGYYLSLFAIIFSLPVFGTGIVYTSGNGNAEEEGKTKLAGPMLNLVIAMALIVIALLLRIFFGGIGYLILFMIQEGIIINGFIALFNMIPVQPFDGADIRKWNQPVCIATAIALVFAMIVGYVVLPYINTMLL